MLGTVGCRPAASPLVVPQRLGVQLYTLRHIVPGDFSGVLREVRRIGYEEVEFAGHYGLDTRDIRGMLEDVGLVAPAGHVSLDALRVDLDGQIESAHVLGHEYLVVPWIDEAERTSLDDYRQVADVLNTIGERMRSEGLHLAYHNHDFEFESFGGEVSGYDVLLHETDPAFVVMELDLYWAVHAGRDPVVYLERYPGRFPLLHVKDRTAEGVMVDVGAGVIDFNRVFEHAAQAGVRHAFVEHDEPADALQSIRTSYDHLARLRRHPHQDP